MTHVERKRMQNEISMPISVSQDGGNVVRRVCITLDQQSGNEDSGSKIKDGGGGRHLGLNVNHRGMERSIFHLAFAFAFALSQFTHVK